MTSNEPRVRNLDMASGGGCVCVGVCVWYGARVYVVLCVLRVRGVLGGVRERWCVGVVRPDERVTSGATSKHRTFTKRRIFSAEGGTCPCSRRVRRAG